MTSTERSLTGGEHSYTDRTDDVETKLELLRQAQRDGRYALALALTDSIKDTLHCERAFHERHDEPVVAADLWAGTSDLPPSWQEWAAGWSLFQALDVDEPAGLARRGEPLDVLVSLPYEHVASPARELRVACIDPTTGALREIPSQVYGVVRRGKHWAAHLVLMVDVPSSNRATYLIFAGNPAAELPLYPSELRVHGEGFGLDIETPDYVASLSRQMGQLEKLASKHRHGPTLYANSEGHGEPPGIDWAHDYMDADGFQKFRVTSWPACPNYEVVRGPLCTIVRRFGFPHSPIHPLFTPSRLLVDVTYTFYGGVPYFIKDSHMDAVQDFSTSVMRDEELVLAGYSFTDALWMDDQWRVHEGTAPPEHVHNVWGAGFFHGVSRDSIFSIRLTHRLDTPAGAPSEAAIPLDHSGPPVLNYVGAAPLWPLWQLWSRNPLPRDASLLTGQSLVQRNAYLLAQYPAAGAGAAALEELAQRLLHPPRVSASGQVPSGVESTASGAPSTSDTSAIVVAPTVLARPGERLVDLPRKRAIWDALREVRYELFYTTDANVVDMGYVYDVRLSGDDVYVLMTMNNRGRPRYNWLANPMRRRIEQLPHVRSVIVDLTWEPAWTPDRLTDAGRRAMGLDAAE